MIEKERELLQVTAVQGGKYRWLAVTALLLAIGAILHMVSPNIGGVTPNWTIAMYCIAINLTRPTLGQAAGIGLVAGAVNIPTSKSAFPYGNLASELVGAVVCALIVRLSIEMTIGRFNLRPAVCAALSTLASGLTFVTILKVVMSLSMTVYLYGMLPVVLGVAVANTIITQLLYLPAEKLFFSKGAKR